MFEDIQWASSLAGQTAFFPFYIGSGTQCKKEKSNLACKTSEPPVEMRIIKYLGFIELFVKYYCRQYFILYGIIAQA